MTSYPMSHSQKRLWFLSRYIENKPLYNISCALEFNGNVSLKALFRSFEVIFERHETFRTSFKDEEDDFLQIIHSFCQPHINIHKIPNNGLTKENDYINDFIDKAINCSFDLRKPPLLNIEILEVSVTKYILVVTMHHIISDAWSMSILINELTHAYSCLTNQKPINLNPLPIQYVDFSEWQRKILTGNKIDKLLVYWKKQLEGIPSYFSMPLDFERPSQQEFNGAVELLFISLEQHDRLKKLSNKLGVSTYMMLVGLYATFSSLYTNETDIVLGTPVANRNNKETEGIIGLFVNTLVLRFRIDFDNTFEGIIHHVKQTLLEAYEHQDLPFETIVQELSPQRNSSFSPLFQLFIAYQNIQRPPVKLDGLLINAIPIHNKTSKFDLSLLIEDDEGGLKIAWEYNTALFKRESILNFISCFETLFEFVLIHQNKQVKDLPLLSAAQKQKILIDFNNNSLPCPSEKSIIDYFELQVQFNPNKPALEFGSKVFTYQELFLITNKFSHYLKSEYNPQPGSLIGVNLKRCEWLIVALIGILKSGCAYVPIDPNYPTERINYIIEDSNCRIVVDENVIRAFLESEKQYSGYNHVNVIQPQDIAYVIYTSGSTGKPKGVIIEHNNLTAFIHWCQQEFANSDFNTMIAVTSVCFDLSIFEIFYTLSVGKKIKLLENHANIGQSIISEEKLLLNTVPSIVGEILKEGVSLGNVSVLNMAGEPIPQHYVSSLNYNKMEIRNLYGPSEDTTYSTVYRIKDDSPISIGKPIANTQVYILNQDLNPLPINVVGEIFIGGSGLARGYLNNSELTSLKFIPSPFKRGERIYQTGDLGKWTNDGNIMFIGRNDDQVKIRGVRIELGEIEKAILNITEIESAHVNVRFIKSDAKSLVAYIVCKAEISDHAIVNALQTSLPSYMIPQYFIRMDKLPHSPNGKIDKQALLKHPLVADVSQEHYMAPTSSTEYKLQAIWKELLDESIIGVESNFFKLGGHSLKAIRLSNRISKVFGVTISLRELFTYSNLKDQANLIDSTAGKNRTAIKPATEADNYVLSSSQRRLWILSQFEEGNVAYNIQGSFSIKGSLDIEILQLSYSKLIHRHEILRTVFMADSNNDPKQYIIPPDLSNFSIITEIIDHETNTDNYILESNLRDVSFPFDLKNGPLIRTKLFRVERDKWILTSTMHHIIGDEWSLSLMLKELIYFYNNLYKGEQNTIKPLQIQYKDYAVWQQSTLNTNYLIEQKKYWLEVFNGSLPVLEFPTDMPRPLYKSFKGGTIRFSVNSTITAAIRKYCIEKESTLFMGLLSVLNVLLYRYTGEADLIIGSPITEREHLELENQIGLYLNTLPLRCKFDETDTFEKLLLKVKQLTLEAYGNQAYPFDELINELQLESVFNRNPLFDIMLVLRNQDIAGNTYPNDSNLEISRLKAAAGKSSKFDLVFTFIEDTDKIDLEIEYNSELFYPGTVQQVGKHLISSIQQLVLNPRQAISKVNFLSNKEKRLILYEFNNTKRNFPSEKSIVELFEIQAKRESNQIAICCDDKSWTYRQLNEYSNRLAHCLKERYGVKVGDFVVLTLDRDLWLIAAIIAVLKNGCINIILDNRDLSSERTVFIQKDSDAQIHLDNSKLLSFIEKLYSYSPDNPSIVSRGEDLAYAIYTSGSTGQSKGVLIKNRGIVNQAFSKIDMLELHTQEVLGHNSKLNFVGATWQLWAPLLSGKRLVLFKDDEIMDLNKLIHKTHQFGIKILELIPSQIHSLLQNNSEQLKLYHIETLILTGEKLNPHYLKQLQLINPHLTIWNAYGQTESSNDTTCFKIEPQYNFSRVLIGKPIQNTGHLIVDKALNIQPIGVAGEICTFGEGIAKGYLNRPELTTEKFVRNPFMPNQVMYRTGDIGRWLPDGNIEYISRVDYQVKIRGHRVELSEIETALLSIEGVENAAVLNSLNSESETELTAFITSKKTLTASFLRTHLSKLLPHFMIPWRFVQIDSLPLTNNLKLDKKKLGAMKYELIPSGVEYSPPESELEIELAGIWSKLLTFSYDQISLNTDFFELGGHSLKALALIHEVKKKWGVSIEIKEVFKNSTLKQFCEVIAHARSEKTDESGIPEMKKNHLIVGPMSYQQEWRWLQFIDNRKSHQANVVSRYSISGEFSLKIAEDTWNLILDRHAILRTVFNETSEGRVQKVTNKKLRILYTNIEQMPTHEQVLHFNQESLKFSITPFDITRELLIRATLMKTGSNTHVLIMCIHHILYDDWSLDILLDEFLRIYNALKSNRPPDLARPEFQFLDYTVWQREFLTEHRINEGRAFYNKQVGLSKQKMLLQGQVNLPFLRQLPASLISVNIEKDIVASLRQHAVKMKVTMQVLLMSILNTTLRSYSKTDITLIIPVANRIPYQTKTLVGGCNNLVMIKLHVSKYRSDFDQIQSINATFNECLSHQHIPIILVEDRTEESYPKWDLSFKYVYAKEKLKKIDGLEISPLANGADLIKPNPWPHFVVEESSNGTLRTLFYYRKGQFNDNLMLEILNKFRLESINVTSVLSPNDFAKDLN